MSGRSDTPGMRVATVQDLDQLDFAKSGGTVTVVTQDADDGRVLMVAQADREALMQTLTTGEMWYRSRSRGLWHKGATSGNTQKLVALWSDCDGDAVLAQVRPAGPACHTGDVSCFGAYAPEVFARLDATIAARASAAEPGTSYTAKLLGDRNLRLKKLGEEAVELATACVDGDADRAAEEGADLVYHTAVALRGVGTGLSSVQRVLTQRER
jgi:phosphoribosyl-AMP cyclohydrolase / phosphoribosyl-ATP pyrophosphohydrolase